MLTDATDVVGVQVDSPVGTSDYGAVFTDVVIEQPIPHLVYKQEVYLKNSEGRVLVKRDVKDLNLNGSIRSSCLVSSLCEAYCVLLGSIKSSSRRVIRMGDKPWLDDRCVLDHHAKQIAYSV